MGGGLQRLRTAVRCEIEAADSLPQAQTITEGQPKLFQMLGKLWEYVEVNVVCGEDFEVLPKALGLQPVFKTAHIEYYEPRRDEGRGA